MKNKIFSYGLFFSLLVMFFVTSIGCSFLDIDSDIDSSSSSSYGFVSISLSAEDNARTVFPSNDYTWEEKFTDLQLFGTKEGGTAQLLASWASYDNIAKDAKSITLEAARWSFTLKAKINDVLFSQTIENIRVTANVQTVLRFTKMTVDTSNTSAKGAISIKMTFPSSLRTSIAKVSAKLDDGEEEELETDNSYYTTATYEKAAVDAGSHLLTFYAYNSTGTKIFVYPTYVVVATGYNSKASLGSTSGEDVALENATSYTVTYNANGGGGNDFTQTFNKGDSILSASDVSFTNTGKTLKCWNTSSDGNGTKYLAGATPLLSDNTTLYAIWIDEGTVIINYVSNYGDSNDVYKEQEYTSSSTLSSTTSLGFSKLGSKFLGWDTKADGSGTRYNASSSQALSGSVNLYAQWCKYDSLSSNYIISTKEDFNAVFNQAESDISDNVKFAEDADFTYPNTDFTNSKTFSGTLDGNGFDLYIKKALFAKNSGTIKNLNVSGIISDSASIAKVNTGTITDCTIEAMISDSTSENVGGIAGENVGVITRCVNTGSVSGAKNVGGIVGYNVNDVTYCNSSATVSSSGASANIGGIVGYNYYDGTKYGAIMYCMAWGKVSASSVEETNVGGICGKSEMSSSKTESVKYCAAAGTIQGGKYKGGIIGYDDKTRICYSYVALEGCYKTSSGEASSGTGGLMGYEYNGNSSTGWEESYTSSENGVDLNCTGGGRNGSLGLNTYNIKKMSEKLAKINKNGTYWYANTGANDVSTKLPYEIHWENN